MTKKRRSGILLHPTSLPGNDGIGTLGKNAYEFVDWLVSAKQTLWQILPLGPTGFGDSPYASFSTFAGNPLLIDLDLLVKNNWTNKDECKVPDNISENSRIDYGNLIKWKMPTLEKCALHFLENCNKIDKEKFESFKQKNISWLFDYSLFTNIKNHFDKKALEQKVYGKDSMWHTFWQKELSLHEENAITTWRKNHLDEIEIINVIQFFFDEQWHSLKSYCNEKGILIIGDIPIFVAPDSSDVWANRKLFQLNENGVPLYVAGVPPDYFSNTGQLWGNPLYDWNEMKNDNYAWWISRVKRTLELVDCIRMDHFRGFESYWAVPYNEETAVNGKWKAGPGESLFTAIKNSLKSVPIIAEDLGVITEEVRSLQDACKFPGMKVLQFAFNTEEANLNGMTNPFLPHNFTNSNCICYTGTHDNDTLQGWLLKENQKTLELVASYVYGENIPCQKISTLVTSGELCKKIVELAFSSVASWTVIPMQDILELDNSARMNEPSTTGKNWQWRMKNGSLTKDISERLSFLSKIFGRNESSA